MTDQEMQTLLESRQGAVSIRDELQNQIDEISDNIRAELLGRGVRTCDPGGPYLPMLVLQERKTINKTKLLSLGVPADVIQQALDVTPVEQFRVTKRGKNGSGGK